MADPPRDLDAMILFDILIYSCEEVELRLRALPWLRCWVPEAQNSKDSEGAQNTRDSGRAPPIPPEMIPILTDIGGSTRESCGRLRAVVFGWKFWTRTLLSSPHQSIRPTYLSLALHSYKTPCKPPPYKLPAQPFTHRCTSTFGYWPAGPTYPCLSSS